MAANIKSFVIDASFMLAFLMPDESDTKVDSYFQDFGEGKINFVSTPLLFLEVANALKMAVVRKRIRLDYAESKLQELLDLAIDTKEVSYLKVFKTAHTADISVYDASYLHLAKSKNLPLLTLDRKLVKLL